MTIFMRHVSKSFGVERTVALSDISIEVKDGDFLSLTGKSGSGKSTLLYVMSGLDNATKGVVEIEGQDVAKMSRKTIHDLRNQKIGFVFQFHYLLPELTALENILMPAIKMRRFDEKLPEAKKLLDQFGLLSKAQRLPRQLSGGEQQRVAIARALIMKPKYIFADEPTGSLDSANGQIVMRILKDINDANQATVVLATHDPDYASYAVRKIELMDGRIISST